MKAIPATCQRPGIWSEPLEGPNMNDDTRLQRRRVANRKWYATHREQEIAKRALIREQNREAIAAAQRLYVAANREKVRASSRAYYSANRDARLAKDRAYNAANRERRAEKQRAWRAANPEGYRLWAAANQEKVWQRNQRRRSRELNAFVEDVDRSVVFERDGGVCQICDTPIGTEKWHVDHRVPLVRGGKHSYDNVQLTHAHCNLSKGTRAAWTSPIRTATSSE